jgi:hypothetical protein
MWFWIGLLILVIGFFLEFEPIKNRLKKKLPSFSERYWLIVLIIFIAGLVTSIINHLKEEQQSSNIRTTIGDIQKGIRHVAADVEIFLSAKWTGGGSPEMYGQTPWPGSPAMILVFEDRGSTLADELRKDHRNLTLFKLNEFLREFRKDKEWVLRCRAESRSDSVFIGKQKSIEVMGSLKGVYFNIMSDSPTIKTDDDLIYINRVEAKLIVNGQYQFEVKEEFSPPRPMKWSDGLFISVKGWTKRQISFSHPELS